MKGYQQTCLYFLFFVALLFTCSLPAQEPEIIKEIFLIGNTADGKKIDRYPAVELLVHHVEQASDSAVILFLGNIFPDAIFKSNVQNLESFMSGNTNMEYYNRLRSSKAKLLFLPGEKEWNYGKVPSVNSVEKVNYFIEKNLDRGRSFFPSGACPGPEEVVLDDQTVIIFIDTQWWLNHEKINADIEKLDCSVQIRIDLLGHLKDAINRHEDKHIIIAGYHPVMSYGTHNGYLPGYTHLTPPLFGTLYNIHRKWIGNYADFANPAYRNMVSGLKEVFQGDQEIVYVSAHENSLQYIQEDRLHQVISGTGAVTAYVKKTEEAFTSRDFGFMKLTIYDNREIFLECWAADGTMFGRKIYERLLYTLAPQVNTPELLEQLDFSEEVIDTLASEAYGLPKKKPGLMGNNYRSEWRETLKAVPYLDIGSKYGGLNPVKRGGGMQTRSLRFKNEDGKQYVIRSIEKFPEAALPDELKNTVVAGLFQDFISSSHPYGALVVPALADRLGVYHTNPMIVYLPDDPRLGIYQEDFANALYLFEERPAKKHRDLASFGKPDDIIGTEDLLEKRYSNNKVRIDQQQVLKSRLFDMWIGDWDRHEDQWRWAEYDLEDKKWLYQAIPRDRDQAFFFNDGLIIKYGARPPGVAKFQGFDYKIRDINGFNYNARHFDRTFLNETSWSDWETTVKRLQEVMNNEAIDSAIHRLPPEIYQYSGNEIIAKLKKRRDDFLKYARTYYEFLTRVVNVVGTEEEEWFEIQRLSDEETRVTVRRLGGESREPKEIIYERIFQNDETKEIHVYGLGGDDLFTVDGEVRKGPVIRIIGGFGKDELENNSRVKGLEKKTVAYDSKDGIAIKNNGVLKDRRSNHPEINSFDRKAFKYNNTRFLGYIDISPDDGVFISADVKTFNYFLRKNPYRWTQQYQVRWSPKVNSFKFMYEGDFIDVIGKWDINVRADAKYPSYTDYYYGLGNETELDEELREEEYYHFRYGSVDLKPLFRYSTRGYNRIFEIGPILNIFRLSDDNPEDRKFREDFPDFELGKWAWFPGLRIGYHLDTRNNPELPFHGVVWKNTLEYINKINDGDIRFTRLDTELSLFQTVGDLLGTTFGLRAGGIFNFGNYEFFQSADLGGKSNLRGHRRMRFSGDKALYFNLDVRKRLFRFRTPLFPGTFGLFGFFDAGRVWYEDPSGEDPSAEAGESDTWHLGYGGGVWVAPLRKYVFTLDLSSSTTDRQLLLNVRYGFFF